MNRLPGDGTTPFDRTHFDFSPWSFWRRAGEEARVGQLALQADLEREWGYEFGHECFVSGRAAVQNDSLRLGDRSYIAAGVYMSGDIVIGRDCSVNPYAVVRGRITIGDAVRIGAHTSIIGFNHVIDDPEVEVFRQGLTEKGIVIGDDVWIGSNVTVLDGVTVGDRAVLAAGAIVTRDVPPGAIVGGNPARLLRWRSKPAVIEEAGGLAEAVESFARRARSQAPDLLAWYWVPEHDSFADAVGGAPSVRAQCDAVEIADVLTGAAPELWCPGEIADRLRGWQDPRSGLVGGLADDARSVLPPRPDAPDAQYHVLAVGYALDLLGSGFEHPIRAVDDWFGSDPAGALDALPWATRAWHAGAEVDAFATALARNRLLGEPDDSRESALFGWLHRRVDPDSGLWGRRTDEGLLQPVNGFYRAVRGSFAQFGLPVPHARRVIDSVLLHARDARHFASGRLTACAALDVAHPLWLTQAEGYRRDEVLELARTLLGRSLTSWVDGEGVAFRPSREARGTDAVPSLQGTEMWLTITWLLADLLGVSASLGYRPRGVHRPEPHPGLVVRPV